MYRSQKESFVIKVRGEVAGFQVPQSRVSATELKFSSMRLFINGFRKIIMRFILSLPSGSRGSQVPNVSVPRRRSCDRPDPPKTSCSSYNYSSNSHYNEAIADCIEFFNKSSQEGVFDGRNSDVMV